MTAEHMKTVEDIAVGAGVAALPLWIQYLEAWAQLGATLLGLILVGAKLYDHARDRRLRREQKTLSDLDEVP